MIHRLRRAALTAALVATAACSASTEPVSFDQDDAELEAAVEEGNAALTVAPDPDKQEPGSSTSRVDFQRLDLRYSWQRTCRPESRWSTPGRYWVATKAGCRSKTARNGRWKAEKLVLPAVTPLCFYTWEPAQDAPVLFVREDGGALQDLAAKTDDGRAMILASCEPVTSGRGTVIDKALAMGRACPDCCLDCFVRIRDEVLTIVP